MLIGENKQIERVIASAFPGLREADYNAHLHVGEFKSLFGRPSTWTDDVVVRSGRIYEIFVDEAHCMALAMHVERYTSFYHLVRVQCVTGRPGREFGRHYQSVFDVGRCDLAINDRQVVDIDTSHMGEEQVIAALREQAIRCAGEVFCARVEEAAT